MTSQPEVLLIEPFYGGSHRQLMDILTTEVEGTELVTMTSKKWHWRARTGSLYLSQVIPQRDSYRVLFASSVLNLAELVALRPDFAKLKKVLYFHENQLIYPVRKQQDRDFQYGYNQIISCLVADVVVFNSEFNRTSFLKNIGTFMKLIPDYRPKELKDILEPKCRVIYFPLKLPSKTLELTVSVDDKGHCETSIESDGDFCFTEKGGMNTGGSEEVLATRLLNKSPSSSLTMQQSQTSDSDGPFSDGSQEKKEDAEATQKYSITSEENGPLHIVWPHRWEHDKGPEIFFRTLYKLDEEGLDFMVSILGETYLEIPTVFMEAKEKLSTHILHWGFVESKEQYYEVLRSADVVVSTAKQEFFGVAMLESVHLGCYPLCPNQLVYPEIFQGDFLYNTEQQLFKKLRNFCRRPHDCRKARVNIDVEKYSWESLQSHFKSLLLS